MNLAIILKIFIFLLLTLILHGASKPIEPLQAPTLLANSSTLSSSSLSSSHTDQPPSILSAPSSSLMKRIITARLLTTCPPSHPHLYRSTCTYSSFASASSPRAYTVHCYNRINGYAMIYFNLFTPGNCHEDEICVDGIVGQGGAVPGPVASCVKMEDLVKYVGVAGKWIRQGGEQGEAQGEGSGTIVSTLSALLPASMSPATSQKYSITALLTTPDNQTLLSASDFAIHAQRQVKTGANNMAWYDLPVISSRSHSLPLGTINNNITKTTTIAPTLIPNNVFNPRNAPPPPPPPPPNPKDTLPLPSTSQTCTACAEVRLASIPPGTQRISVDVQLPARVESGVLWMIGGGG